MPRRWRRVAWVLLVAIVAGVHGCVTERVVSGLSNDAADNAMPPRMEVEYVKEMALTAPPPTATAAAPVAEVAAASPAPVPVRKRKPPKVPKAPKPASAPASTPPPEAMVADNAASEPSVEDAASSASAPEASPASAADPVASAPRMADAASAASTVASAASASSPSSSAQRAASAPASAASGPKAFQWPVSTRVRYLLTGNYRGAVSGSAQVEWIRSGDHYQVHVDFIIGPSVAPLITQRSTSDGEISAAGLVPRRYDQDIQVFGSTRPRQTVLFDAGNVILANGDVRPEAPGMQDTASQFVQLTYLFSIRPELLHVGGSIDIPLALPRKVDVWTYDVVDEADLNTPFGVLRGIHLKPRNPPSPGAINVEMWFAPQLQYFPARLRFEQDGGNYVDLMIEKPPQMALH